MRIDGLELKATQSPSAYVGVPILIDDQPHRIGSMLGFGEEKWVFELLDRDDKPVDKVIKIYRDEDGESARYEAFMVRLLKGGPIQTLDIEICQVSGGYVGIQERVGSDFGRDSAAARRDALRRDIISRLERGERMDYDEELKSARDADDQELEAGLRQHRGILLVEAGQTSQAVAEFSIALDLFEKLGDADGVLRSSNAIGEAHRRAGRSADARLWYERARATAEEHGATSSLGIVYHNLGILCQNEALKALESGDAKTVAAKFDEADQFLHKSLEIWQELGESERRALTLGQLGRLYLFRESLDKAEEYATQALRIREVIGMPDVFIDYNTLGLIARAKGDEKMAAEWFRKRDATEPRAHGSPAPGGGVAISVGAIAEACVEVGLRGEPVPSELDSALADLGTSGPPMDIVADFLRRIADGDFPDQVPPYRPAIFRDYLEELLEKVKVSRRDRTSP